MNRIVLIGNGFDLAPLILALDTQSSAYAKNSSSFFSCFLMIFFVMVCINTEVKMEPLVKSVYLLFLSHPEGIVLKSLPDYRKELTELYLLLRPYGMTDRVMQSIEDVTNPTQNSINEKCARIRKAFAGLLPQSVARYYAISGKRGEAKKIDLVRANVVWKCKMPVSQGL